jgi:hypothetical protein
MFAVREHGARRLTLTQPDHSLNNSDHGKIATERHGGNRQRVQNKPTSRAAPAISMIRLTPWIGPVGEEDALR